MNHFRQTLATLSSKLSLTSTVETRAKALWLIRLRWAAVAAMIFGLAGFRYYGLISPDDVPLYALAVSALILANVGLSVDSIYTRVSIFWQLMLDLAVLGLTLGMTQGCANPMSSLIYMHAVLGPLLLAGRQGILYLGAIGFWISYYCLKSQPAFHGLHGRPLPHVVSLVGQLIVVGAIWSLTLYLASRLRALGSDLQRAREQCQRADHLRALGAMAASFTHEFATPLNTAKMRLDRLARLEGGSSDRSVEDDLIPSDRGTSAKASLNQDIAAARAAIAQCESVMRSMFGSELQAGHIRFDKVDLAAFVTKVCRGWQSQNSDVILNTSVSAAIGEASRYLPKLALARSLVDLLDNAREAKVGEKAQIEVSVTGDNSLMIISVADRGKGVPDYLRSRIAEAFVSTRPDGTGLGLYTARALAEALGGSLEVVERSGGGTIVNLSIATELAR